MLASVTIARESGNKQALALPFFSLARLQEDLGELSDAVESYKEAIANMQNNPPETHKFPAVLADMQIHLATCEYKAGDKTALERAEKALVDLQAAADEPNKFSKDVWLSGAHMRIAEILKTDNPQKAKNHLQQAKTIIDANPELILRQKQWQRLADTF
jgi:tetratricopeptide (TPR) repeat protein